MRIPLLDKEGMDLVSRLLQISPCERYVAKHLLDHPWFSDIRDQIKNRIRSWCTGLERGYEVLVTVDRFPPAQVLNQVNKENEKNKDVARDGMSLYI